MTCQKKLRVHFLEQTNRRQKVDVPVFLDNLSGELLEKQLNELIAMDVLLTGRKRNRQTKRCDGAEYIIVTKNDVFKN